MCENTIFVHTPDSHENSLHLLHLNIVSHGEEHVKLATKAHLEGCVAKPAAFDSIFKDVTTLMLYARPYKFAAFHDVPLFKPMEIYQAQHVTTKVCLNNCDSFFHFLLCWCFAASQTCH